MSTPPQPHEEPSTADAARTAVARLTREEKLRLVSGADFWRTAALEEHGIASVMLTDGPHGLRKQRGSGDHVGLSDSEPATCFPTAVTLGSSWDVALVEAVGAALGREARAQDVGVLLGPGLNLKRHPAGGRCFEYFSEDPLLSGRLAAAMVRGIQSEGVGACAKHFVANNQEAWRMRLDTVVDERTLRELYLPAFEEVVTQAHPWAVMSSYNLVGGEHVGESRRLLTGILREEWGFDGLVVSDWLAVADRPASLHAGLDLEMPTSAGAWDARVVEALETGALGEADLDLAATRVVELALKVTAGREAAGGTGVVDLDAHHALARRAAAAGTVLLTNDGVLPLAASGRIAVIGAFAEHPRYQGSGSSLVQPTRLDTALEAMRARLGDEAELVYAPGYDPATGDTTPALLSEARRAASGADAVVVLVGLPTTAESEGFDRTTLRLPDGHDALVEVVASANPRTVVALSNGGAVELPWADRVAAVLECFLGGQAGGSALVDVLLGDAEPGGRLAESFPVTGAELPAAADFASHPTQVRYRETQYVGYRFHDSFDVAPRFCLGHGLGYTTFTLSDLVVEGTGTDLTASVTVRNTGIRPGSEVVQLYVHDVASTLHRPEQELKGFAKVHLLPGESERVSMPLDRRSFAVWDTASGSWLVEAGRFEVRVGRSSRDVAAVAEVDIASDDVVTPVAAPAGPVATDAELAVLLGRPVPEPRPLLPLHEDSTIDDLGLVALGRPLRAALLGVVRRTVDVGDTDPGTRAMLDAVLGQMPLRAIVAGSDGRVGFGALARILRVLNASARLPRGATRRPGA